MNMINSRSLLRADKAELLFLKVFLHGEFLSYFIIFFFITIVQALKN